MPVLIYIALGSNLGDRAAHCAQAVVQLRAHGGFAVDAVSPLFEYPALTRDPHDAQPPYLNGVVAAHTTLAPAAVLAALEAIERAMGRTHKSDWAARTIDLDLLLYGNQIIRDARLSVPHPALHTRRFVLKPLAELAPDLVIPGLRQTARALLEAL